jgi:hypothetical protein
MAEGDYEIARKQERAEKATQMKLNLIPAEYDRLQAKIHR